MRMAERKQWKWADDPSLNKMEFTKLEKDGLDVIETIVNTYSKKALNRLNLLIWIALNGLASTSSGQRTVTL